MKKILIILGACIFLVACHPNTKSQKSGIKTYKVKMSTLKKTLHFTGIVQPIRESTITATMEGMIDSMQFHYGQTVKKDEVVFIVNSAALQKQYNDILTDYLKAKDNFTISQAKFIGTEDLWKVGLLSKNNYLGEKSSLNTNRIALMQATHRLKELLEKMEGNPQLEGDKAIKKILAGLNITDFDKVRAALSSKHNLIYLKAPGNGVLLYPPKSAEDKDKHLQVGSPVKAGQVLALVGDLSGIALEIDIPEVDIDKIRAGMPAMVHGVAFGGQALQGEVIAINAQASVNNNGGLPSFTAIVEVKSLSTEQQALLRVGMSAAIELSIDETAKLMVPIEAIQQEHGQSVVKIRAPDGTIEVRPVMTGSALADKVVVSAGLQSGETLVYG